MRQQFAVWTAQACLLALVTITPWIFGGVHASVQAPCFLVLLVCLACWAYLLWSGRGDRQALPRALIPLLAALAFGVFHLLPVGPSLHGWLSPRDSEFRRGLPSVAGIASAEQSADVAEPAPATSRDDDEAPSGLLPLSRSTSATRYQWSLLAMGVITFALGARFFSRATAQLMLYGVLTANGVALAFFGLVQKMTWNGKLFWRIPLPDGDINAFASYVNRNNGVGYLCMCLAGALAIVFWAQRQSVYRHQALVLNFDTGRVEVGPVQAPWWASVWEAIGNLTALKMTGFIAVTALVAAIIAALSRSGLLALFGATVVTLWMVRKLVDFKIRWWMFVGVIGCAVLFIAWMGLARSVETRFQYAFDPAWLLRETRFQNWHDSLQAWTDFWLQGSGLGTYPYTYGPYQQRYFHGRFVYAENDYVDALVVGGVVGLALLLITLAMVAFALRQMVRLSRDRVDVALAIAGIFAVTSQVIQSCFDFGLYLAANLMVFALICGAVSGRAVVMAAASRRKGAELLPKLTLPQSSVRVSVAVLFILAVSALFGWNEARSMGAIKDTLRDFKRQKIYGSYSASELQAAMQRLSPQLERRWDDADGHLAMAQLWLRLFNVEAYNEVKSKLPPEERKKVRMADFASELHTRASQYAFADNRADLEQLRAEPLVKKNLEPAWMHLVAARQGCAYIPEIHRWLGTLCFLVGDPFVDQQHFAQALYVAPTDAYMQFEIGLLDLYGGREDEAVECLKRAWQLDNYYWEPIVKALLPRLTVTELMDRVVPASPAALVDLARFYYKTPEQAKERRLVLQRAEQLLATFRGSEAQKEFLAGSISGLQGEHAAAIKHLMKAVDLAPTRVEWRFELAEQYKEAGDIEKARQEAGWCVLNAPQVGRYRTFLDRLPRAPAPAPRSPHP